MRVSPAIRTVLLAAILFSVAAVYAQTLWHGFINFDDDSYVTENAAIADGLNRASVYWAFTAFHSSNWHPLTWLSHALDISLFGLHPAGHHAVNVLLHILNTWLVYVLAGMLLAGSWRPLLFAALFGLHPLHVESVAWIAERKDLLSAAFGLGALCVYCAGARRANWWGYYSAALFFFAASLMSKPMLVTLPCVMLLLDVWPLRRVTSSRRALVCLLEKLPFFALVVVSAILTLEAQENALIALESRPLLERVNNAAVAYSQYVFKTFVPWNLATPYPYHADHSRMGLVTAWMLLALVTAAALAFARRRPGVTLGWIWFLGALVPVIGIVQVGEQAMADRYTYFPHVGLFLALLSLMPPRIQSNFGKRVTFLSAGSLTLILALLTAWQLRHWKSSETLFTRALEVTSENYVAHNNLGKALMQRGAFADALGHFQESARIRPGNLDARNNLGAAYLATGRPTQAIRELEGLLQYQPMDAPLRLNLGVAYFSLGLLDRAQQEAELALNLDPSLAQARELLERILSARSANDSTGPASS